MPADLFKRLNGKPRVNLDKLYLPFLEKALAVLAECRDNGVDYYVIADQAGDDGGGYRSYTAQAKLYFQGRTAPGAIVTDARPGYSAHNFGVALDVARDGDATKPGLQPVWGNADYDELGRVAQRHGLVWGGTFSRKDRPHIQWPGVVTGRELEPLRQAYAKRLALVDVWAYLDALG